MSAENVKVVVRAYASLNRGDADALAAALHPEAEWHAYLNALDATNSTSSPGPEALASLRARSV